MISEGAEVLVDGREGGTVVWLRRRWYRGWYRRGAVVWFSGPLFHVAVSEGHPGGFAWVTLDRLTVVPKTTIEERVRAMARKIGTSPADRFR